VADVVVDKRAAAEADDRAPPHAQDWFLKETQLA